MATKERTKKQPSAADAGALLRMAKAQSEAQGYWPLTPALIEESLREYTDQQLMSVGCMIIAMMQARSIKAGVEEARVPFRLSDVREYRDIGLSGGQGSFTIGEVRERTLEAAVEGSDGFPDPDKLAKQVRQSCEDLRKACRKDIEGRLADLADIAQPHLDHHVAAYCKTGADAKESNPS